MRVKTYTKLILGQEFDPDEVLISMSRDDALILSGVLQAVGVWGLPSQAGDAGNLLQDLGAVLHHPRPFQGIELPSARERIDND